MVTKVERAYRLRSSRRGSSSTPYRRYTTQYSRAHVAGSMALLVLLALHWLGILIGCSGAKCCLRRGVNSRDTVGVQSIKIAFVGQS